MTRKSKNLKIRKSIAIFCEGKSEQQYFNMLKQKYRQSMIKIKVIDSKLSGKKLLRLLKVIERCLIVKNMLFLIETNTKRMN